MLLNLVVNYGSLQGPAACCGCSKKTQSALLAAIQITLVVCAILAIANVGCFEQIGSLRAVLIAAGAVVLVTDIVLTVLHRRALPSSQKPGVQETEAARKARIDATIASTKANIQIRQLNDGSYVVDLTRLAPNSSSPKKHIYPIFSESTEKQGELSEVNQFFFYFRNESSHDLSNVVLIVSENDYQINDPNWVEGYQILRENDHLAMILKGDLVCPFETPQD